MADNRYVMKRDEHGSVEISMDVIATIIGIAALKVEGVSSLHGGITAENIEHQTSKVLAKGIRIGRNDEGVSIDIALNLKFGTELMEVVPSVQEKVKDTVEDMIGIEISSVNVKIVGIDPESAQ